MRELIVIENVTFAVAKFSYCSSMSGVTAVDKSVSALTETVDITNDSNKNSSGKIVKTFSKKVYPQLNQWIWSDSYKLTSKGTYLNIYRLFCTSSDSSFSSFLFPSSIS